MAVQADTRAREPLSYRDMVLDSPSDFRLRPQVYTHPQIFEDEMRYIYGRTWVYVAHESEVPSQGDFVTRYIGKEPVIVSRSQDNRIHVLLNVCRHRGNIVCRERRGNSNFFRCPYHGWIYSNSGDLVTVIERDGYPPDFGQDVTGLVEAPRVAVYRGLIFASLSGEVEDFEAYLGAVKEYVDLWVERSPDGAVRLLPPHRYVYAANWKFQAEQDTDGYHGSFVHESAFKTTDHFMGSEFRAARNAAVHGAGRTRGFPRGHCILERPGTRAEMPPELLKAYKDLLVSRYGAERAEKIAMVRHIFIFPNVYLMDRHIRVHDPIAVDRTEVHSYFNFLEGIPEDANRARFENLQSHHGQAGAVGTDDVEMFVRCQSGMQASTMEWIHLSRGLHREETFPTGEIVSYPSDEVPQRAIYREWVRLMSAAPR